MWPFKKKLKSRRLDVRRRTVAMVANPWLHFREAGGPRGLMLAAMFFAGVLLLDIRPLDPLRYLEGQYVPADIHSRVDFQTHPEHLLREGISNANQSAPATFAFNEQLAGDILNDLSALPEALEAVSPMFSPPTSAPASGVAPTTRQGQALVLLKKFGMDGGRSLSAWGPYLTAAGREQYQREMDQLKDRLRRSAIINSEEIAEQQKRAVTDVWLVYPGGRELKDLQALVRGDRSSEVGEETENLASVFDPPIRADIKTYLLGMLVGSRPPLYSKDTAASIKDIDERVARLKSQPPVEKYVAGQVLVRASRRDGDLRPKALTQDDLQLLAREQEAFLQQESGQDSWAPWRRVMARAGILLLLMAVLCRYVWRYQRQIIASFWHGLTVAVVMLGMLAVSKVMVQGLGWNPHAAVLPVIMTTTVLTIAYNHRFSIAMGTVLAMMTVLQLRGDMSLLLVLLAGMAGSIVFLNEVRRRSKLIEVSAVAALVVLLATAALGIAADVPLPFIALNAAWAAGFALLAGFLIQGVLPLIERMFNVATSMTLLEWCDASKPLLKRLAMEAPGTYNHSLQLGAICESAAEAIGARGLMARVGAYYHDIGKINKPHYFSENTGGDSTHDGLSPTMSMLVIIAHVKDGLEMAYQYALPKVLHQFIATHHGTTLVQYFYHEATRQKNGDRVPDEQEFRYGGPKPASKEAGILMLADAAESSVRSLANPTPGQIEDQVRTMVSRRLMDGQLDECEMTLQEVHRVETSLIKSICGIYHSRIAYPVLPGQKPAGSEQLICDDPSPAAPPLANG
ncbi:MAG: HDIG domain-containing metalloprotein [Planctomycetaceae bacterium]|nr:HDIG domain-containing protein [Planctomycetaceae bacterium]